MAYNVEDEDMGLAGFLAYVRRSGYSVNSRGHLEEDLAVYCLDGLFDESSHTADYDDTHISDLAKLDALLGPDADKLDNMLPESEGGYYGYNPKPSTLRMPTNSQLDSLVSVGNAEHVSETLMGAPVNVHAPLVSAASEGPWCPRIAAAIADGITGDAWDEAVYEHEVEQDVEHELGAARYPLQVSCATHNGNGTVGGGGLVDKLLELTDARGRVLGALTASAYLEGNELVIHSITIPQPHQGLSPAAIASLAAGLISSIVKGDLRVRDEQEVTGPCSRYRDSSGTILCPCPLPWVTATDKHGWRKANRTLKHSYVDVVAKMHGGPRVSYRRSADDVRVAVMTTYSMSGCDPEGVGLHVLGECGEFDVLFIKGVHPAKTRVVEPTFDANPNATSEEVAGVRISDGYARTIGERGVRTVLASLGEDADRSGWQVDVPVLDVKAATAQLVPLIESAGYRAVVTATREKTLIDVVGRDVVWRRTLSVWRSVVPVGEGAAILIGCKPPDGVTLPAKTMHMQPRTLLAELCVLRGEAKRDTAINEGCAHLDMAMGVDIDDSAVLIMRVNHANGKIARVRLPRRPRAHKRPLGGVTKLLRLLNIAGVRVRWLSSDGAVEAAANGAEVSLTATLAPRVSREGVNELLRLAPIKGLALSAPLAPTILQALKIGCDNTKVMSVYSARLSEGKVQGSRIQQMGGPSRELTSANHLSAIAVSGTSGAIERRSTDSRGVVTAPDAGLATSRRRIDASEVNV